MTAIPVNTAITGGGSNGAKNVLRVRFPNAPLAATPILQAFTTGGATPVATQGANEDHTFYNNTDSCVYAITTDDKASAAALNNWAENLTDDDPDNFGTSPAWNENGRKLNGNTSTLQLADDSDTRYQNSNATYYFNIAYRLGVNTQENAGQNAFVTGVQYIYTGGTDPGVIWEGNKGTENAPSWEDSPTASSIAGDDADFLGGSPVATPRKIIHAKAGANPSNPVIAKPQSGKVFSKAIVVQAG